MATAANAVHPTCACCPKCRIRFSRAATVHYAACPQCGRKPVMISSLEEVVGFQLITLQVPEPAAGAVALAIGLPRPSGEAR